MIHRQPVMGGLPGRREQAMINNGLNKAKLPDSPDDELTHESGVADEPEFNQNLNTRNPVSTQVL